LVVNDRHPSGGSTPTVPAPDASYPYYEGYGEQQGTAHGYAGCDGYSTGSYNNLGAAYGEGDPLFGALPGSYDDGQSGQYDATQWSANGQYGTGQYDTGAYGTTGQYDTGQYATGGYDTGGYDTGGHDTGGHDTGGHDTGAYDTTAMWAASGYQFPTGIPTQQDADTGGQWDSTAWNTQATGHTEMPAQWDTGAGYDTTGQHNLIGQYDGYDTSGVDTGQTQFWDNTGFMTVDESQHEQPGYEQPHTQLDQPGFDPSGYEQPGIDQPGVDQSGIDQSGYEQPGIDQSGVDQAAFEQAAFEQTMHHPAAPEAEPEPEAAAEHGLDLAPESESGATPPPSPSPRRDAGRARRRTASSRPKRSALLTVAVPSVCALGVTAVAAASVSGVGGDNKDTSTTQAAPDAAPPVKVSAANSKLDSQLAGVREGADDFRDRASRTQERIDLKARQAADKKRRAEEAARKERLRPKFMLPVTQHGLSATFGQAGINWMSVHTGIDFPVSYGTTVRAATDGTVRTQWNDAYGNMVILTSPDGTETWYCHLSSAKIRSGSVKAGDTIAFSGNSGNSTGPHLHFEVHPGGGAAVDPLPWLRGHGVDPT
jgi:murein DD-endopeptidase MepM/ murein hydrolase activator NlpD